MTREAELRKGCGKPIDAPDKCSSCGDISFSNKILYCPTCQAELKGITETNSKWKQAVQKLKDKMKKRFPDAFYWVEEDIIEVFGELIK